MTEADTPKPAPETPQPSPEVLNEKIRLEDKQLAIKKADELLKASADGKLTVKGKEYVLPDDKRAELTFALRAFANDGVARFDKDRDIGLSETEWKAFLQELNSETEKWLEIGKKAEIEKLKKSIDELSQSSLEAIKGEFEGYIASHPNYLRASGAWKEIHKALANMLNIDTETYFSDEEVSLAFGAKIQGIVRGALPKLKLTEDGKIGPKTMTGIAVMFGLDKKMDSVREMTEGVDWEWRRPKPEGTSGTGGATSSEAGKPRIAGGQPVQGGQPMPEAEAREREMGFAKQFAEGDWERIKGEYSMQDMMQMLAQAREGMSEKQNLRLNQLFIYKTALESMMRDVDGSRTWGEAAQQVGELSAETRARRMGLEQAIAQVQRAIVKVPSSPLDVSLDDLLGAHLEPERLGPITFIPIDVRDWMRMYKLQDGQQDASAKRAQNISGSEDGLIDAQGRLRDVKTFDELNNEYLKLLEFLRSRRDYATAQTLLEDTLLGKEFEQKRHELEQKEKTRIDAAANAAETKLHIKMIKAKQNYLDAGWSDGEFESHTKQLIEIEKNRAKNKIVAELNNGRPFAFETGDKRNQFQEIYRDMMGTGDWHNLSDASWDSIIDELAVNAPLIVISGGVAAGVARAFSVGARALLATGRLATLSQRIAGATSTLGRLGQRALYMGARGATLGVEAVAFDLTHMGLQGELLFNQPEWAKQVLWTAISLKAFKFGGAASERANAFIAKHVTKVTDKSVAAAIQKLAISGNVEAAAMLTVSAAQHAYEGNFDDWELAHELFHAYVSVGALKIAHGGVATAKGKLFAPGSGASRSGSLVEKGRATAARVGEKAAEFDKMTGEAKQLADEKIAARKAAEKMAKNTTPLGRAMNAVNAFSRQQMFSFTYLRAWQLRERIFYRTKISDPKLAREFNDLRKQYTSIIDSQFANKNASNMNGEARVAVNIHNKLVPIVERAREIIKLEEAAAAKAKIPLSAKPVSTAADASVAKPRPTLREKFRDWRSSKAEEKAEKRREKETRLAAKKQESEAREVARRAIDHACDKAEKLANPDFDSLRKINPRSDTLRSAQKEVIRIRDEILAHIKAGAEISPRTRRALEKLKDLAEKYEPEATRRESYERRTNPEKKEYDEVARESEVISIPDIHGDIVALRKSLRAQKMIDASGKWIGGKKVLQFAGDYVDRGRTNLQVLDFIIGLNRQAQLAGGRVDLLIGNHEAFMLGALLGSKQDMAMFKQYGNNIIHEVMTEHKLRTVDDAVAKLRELFFAPNGRFREFLDAMKPVSQVDDVLYVHAGVSPKWAQVLARKGVLGVNEMWKKALMDAQAGDFTLFNEFNEIGGDRGGSAEYGGLFWADFSAEIATMPDHHVAQVASALKSLGINAIVVGHTPLERDKAKTAQNFERHGIKIVDGDVGMSDGYRGQNNSGHGGVQIGKDGTISSDSHQGAEVLHQGVGPAAAAIPDAA